MGNAGVAAAVITTLGVLGGGVLAWLSQRSGKRQDAQQAQAAAAVAAREAQAERAVAVAERASEQLEEARTAILKVKDDHIAMLTADNDKLRAQVNDLAAKVAAYEARPHRKDDGCVG